MRNGAGRPLAIVKVLSVLTEGAVEDDRKNQAFVTGKTVWQKGRTYTIKHTQAQKRNVDRKTACCQDRVFIYCFPSASVLAP